jgi:hypothetical protein
VRCIGNANLRIAAAQEVKLKAGPATIRQVELLKMCVLRARCTLVICAFALLVLGARCSCPGAPSNLPITDATSMTMVSNVTQGTMFIAGPVDNTLRVVHVWGTSYEMGYAQGLLLRNVLPDVYSTFVAYVEALIEADIKNIKWIKYLPEEIRAALERASLSEALELTYKATRQFTPQVRLLFLFCLR